MHRIDHAQATGTGVGVVGDVTAGSPLVTNISTTSQLYVNAPVSVDVGPAEGMEFKIIEITQDTITLDAPVPAPGTNVLVEIIGDRFTEGDPQRGRARTVVTDAWANSVQEEIAQAIELDRDLDKTRPGQLADVIRAVVGRDITGLQVVPLSDRGRVSISEGACLDSTETVLIRNDHIEYLTMDAYGTAGSGGTGGLPSNLTQTADESYYVFIIKKKSGEVSLGFDTSESATNLLTETGFDYYRCIDVVRLDDAKSFILYDLVGETRIVHQGWSLIDQTIDATDEHDLSIPSLVPALVDAYMTVTADSGSWELWYRLDRDGDATCKIAGADGEVVQIPIRFSARPDGKIKLTPYSGSPKVTLRVISFTPQLP